MADQPTGIFNDNEGVDPETPPSTPPASVPADTDVATILAAIKNERGEQKYDNLPKALEGLLHAQDYIPQLKTQLTAQEQELAQLREKLAKTESVDEVVARLTASQASTTTTETGLDEQKAAALFEQLLSQREVTQRSSANQETVQSALVTQFGTPEAANKAVIEKAKELGTTAEEIGKLSSQNPKMVLELFKSVQGAPTGAPPTPSVNTDGFLSQVKPETGLTKPTKSLLAGATYKEQKAYLDQVRDEVYKKFGVTT